MWLINDALKAQLERAYASGWHVTTEIKAATDRQRAERLPSPSLSSSGVATIDVIGPLTKNPDPFLAFFLGSNTAYTDINDQIVAAVGDPNVSSIELFIDSPGGNVDGLFETLDTIAAAREQKPISVRADNAHSAAFAIAAAAGSVAASSRGAMFGSVGVATSFIKDDPIGHITSTEAPDKRPDPNTKAGQTAIVAQLDAIHDLFVGSIATGRGTSPETVNKDFGRGASFMAGESLQRGMIDSIAEPALSIVSNLNTIARAKETNQMDLQELKAQHPELVSALVAEGTRQERDRVCAHITLGQQSGDLKTAFDAINSGEDLTAKITAQYLAASMASRDLNAQSADDADAAAALAASGNGADEDNDLSSQVANLVEKQLGIGVGA